MPNNGIKIYTQGSYGISLDADVCYVLGLSAWTDLKTAAASDKVNADSLIRPIPTTANPPDESQLGGWGYRYGYNFPQISLAKTQLTSAEAQAILTTRWQRQAFTTNDYAALNHFNGYNHTVRFSDVNWGVPQIAASPRSLNIYIRTGNVPDLLSPQNMACFATWHIGIAVYRKQGDNFMSLWAACSPALNQVTNGQVSFIVGDDTAGSSSIIAPNTVYLIVPFLCETAFSAASMENVQSFPWGSQQTLSMGYSASAPSVAVIVTPNETANTAEASPFGEWTSSAHTSVSWEVTFEHPNGRPFRINSASILLVAKKNINGREQGTWQMWSGSVNSGNDSTAVVQGTYNLTQAYDSTCSYWVRATVNGAVSGSDVPVADAESGGDSGDVEPVPGL